MSDEITRFWSKVVKGPDSADCWIWTGAIGDDGYGRFWTTPATGEQKMIRAHRYACDVQGRCFGDTAVNS